MSYNHSLIAIKASSMMLRPATSGCLSAICSYVIWFPEWAVLFWLSKSFTGEISLFWERMEQDDDCILLVPEVKQRSQGETLSRLFKSYYIKEFGPKNKHFWPNLGTKCGQNKAFWTQPADKLIITSLLDHKKKKHRGTARITPNWGKKRWADSQLCAWLQVQ